MRINQEKTFVVVKILLILILTSIFSWWVFPQITSEGFQNIVKQSGHLGPLVLIIYIVLSHVFVPLSATPVVILSYGLFGVVATSIYVYVAGLISATINFYIARKFGRVLVERLAGKKSMESIDDFATKSGNKVLIISRLFGFPIYDVISYAAGLTEISFKNYFIITAVFGAIPAVIFLLFLKDVDLTQPRNFIILTGVVILVGVLFAYLLKQYFKKLKLTKKG